MENPEKDELNFETFLKNILTNTGSVKMSMGRTATGDPASRK